MLFLPSAERYFPFGYLPVFRSESEKQADNQESHGPCPPRANTKRCFHDVTCMIKKKALAQ